MKHHWQQLLTNLGYMPGMKVIDIGGAMDPVPVADVIVDPYDLGKGGKSYTLLDLNCSILPFKNKEFDICICCQTLEDLCSPILTMIEMSRIAKRGIISCPHRGSESVKNTYYDTFNKQDYSMDEVWHFGTGHHKWLIENIAGYLCFIPKVQYLLMRYPIPEWRGPAGIDFYWNDEINFKVFYDVSEKDTEKNYALFRDNNKQFWETANDNITIAH